MKRLLIRAGMTPFENVSLGRVIARNLIGRNAGNLMYQGAIMRALMTSDDMEFVPDRYLLDDRDAAWINDNCDAYIIALADAFRPAIGDLKRVTRLVKSLTIPCIVIGTGLRCELDESPVAEHPFDDAVRQFMNAVLEKSATVGLRGTMTAEYLGGLGYREGEHFRVIGCPSMYWSGAKLPRRELVLPRDPRISVNMNVYTKPVGNDLLLKILDTYPNSVYTAQLLPELHTLYLSEEYDELERLDAGHLPYPRHITDDLYAHDRVRFFLSINEWMDFLATMDLSVGGRMHGNVAAIQAGCPAALIVKDRRMSELVEYHALPHLLRADVNTSWSLEEFLAHIDMEAMHDAHPANFANYVRFLEENGLEHVFSENETPAPRSTPFDRVSRSSEPQEAPTTSAGLSAEELAARWRVIVKEETEWRKELAKRQVTRERTKAAKAQEAAVAKAREEAIQETVAEMRLKRRIARKLGLRK